MLKLYPEVATGQEPLCPGILDVLGFAIFAWDHAWCVHVCAAGTSAMCSQWDLCRWLVCCPPAGWQLRCCWTSPGEEQAGIQGLQGRFHWDWGRCWVQTWWGMGPLQSSWLARWPRPRLCPSQPPWLARRTRSWHYLCSSQSPWMARWPGPRHHLRSSWWLRLPASHNGVPPPRMALRRWDVETFWDCRAILNVSDCQKNLQTQLHCPAQLCGEKKTCIDIEWLRCLFVSFDVETVLLLTKRFRAASAACALLIKASTPQEICNCRSDDHCHCSFRSCIRILFEGFYISIWRTKKLLACEMRFKDSQSTVDSCHVFARLRVHGQLFRFVVTCSAMNQHLFSQISNWVRAAFCHKHSTHLAWHRRFPSKLRCLLRHPSYATSLWPLWRWRKSQTLWNLKAREHFNFNVFQLWRVWRPVLFMEGAWSSSERLSAHLP